MTIRDKRLQVLKALKDGVLEIVFTKANGEERRMKATKNTGKGAVDGLNTKEKVEKELSTGVVEVFDMDKSAMRAFNFTRLTAIKLEGTTKYVKYAEEEDASEKATPLSAKSGKEISVENQIKRLNKKVVRLVFTKKDGTKRIMFATRNGALIDSHMEIGTKRKESESSMNSPEKIAAQISKDYVNVFDLQDRKFKMYKPSQLCDYDESTGVGNWIEFNPDDDGWFMVMRGEKPIKSVFKKDSFSAKPVGKGVSSERILLENKNKAYKQIQENQKKNLRGDEVERLEFANKRIDYICKNLKDKYTSYDLAVFDKLKEVAYKLKADFDRKESIGQEHVNSILSEVKHSERNKTVTLVYNWGKDVFIFNPRFALNAISHKVFVDRTSMLRFENVRRSKMTASMVSDVKSLIKYVAKRRKRGAENLKLSEADVERLKRYAVLVNKEQDKLKSVGLNAIFANKGNVQAIAFKGTNGAEFFISPLYVFDASTKTKRFVYQRKHRGSTLKPMVEFIQSNFAALKLTKEQTELVIKLTIVAFNRKRKIPKEQAKQAVTK